MGFKVVAVNRIVERIEYNLIEPRSFFQISGRVS